MCQINSKPVKKKWVKGVRVYWNFSGESLFKHSPKPKIGIWVKKKSGKIHACKSLDDARLMARDSVLNSGTPLDYYAVILSGNIKIGKWSGRPTIISTYTADRMKIIRRIK